MKKKKPRRKSVKKSKPVLVNNPKGKEINDIQNKKNIWIEHFKINWFNYVGVISLLLTIFFFILTPNKKDIEPINNGVINIQKDVAELKQDKLEDEDYKDYLKVYNSLYNKHLGSLFPGGYIIFGLRNGEIYSPERFISKYIQSDITGIVIFDKSNFEVKIVMKDVVILENNVKLSECRVSQDIRNYEIAKPYILYGMDMGGWKHYVYILSDDITNPVFVLGFSKLELNES